MHDARPHGSAEAFGRRAFRGLRSVPSRARLKGFSGIDPAVGRGAMRRCERGISVLDIWAKFPL